MESFFNQINAAYKKGIENPRFQKAINEIVKNPQNIQENQKDIEKPKTVEEGPEL